jgi:hypothetical protein
MNPFGGVGRAIKGAGGAIGMGGGNRPPVDSPAQAEARGGYGGSIAPAIANENQRTLMGGGLSEADAIRAAYSPSAGSGFVPRGQRMPLPSGGFGPSTGSAMGQARGMGGAMRMRPAVMPERVSGPMLPNQPPDDPGMGAASAMGAWTGGPKFEQRPGMATTGQGMNEQGASDGLLSGGSGLEQQLMKRQAMGRVS